MFNIFCKTPVKTEVESVSLWIYFFLTPALVNSFKYVFYSCTVLRTLNKIYTAKESLKSVFEIHCCKDFFFIPFLFNHLGFVFKTPGSTETLACLSSLSKKA